ncbi:MAG: hypothetical protein IPN96_21290 [Anaerolineales bacterium]|nr:hypothetical protein [Anaerolineales bacterium]
MTSVPQARDSGQTGPISGKHSASSQQEQEDTDAYHLRKENGGDHQIRFGHDR